MEKSHANKKCIVAVLWAVSIVAACLITYFARCYVKPADTQNADVFSEAVGDAVKAETDEIKPLVSISPESDMVTWNESGDKVLMLSWNKYPQSYIAGEEFTCEYGEIWTFTDREILKWYQENAEGVENWSLRLEQLIGLPEGSGYTHMSAFWVSPEELIRPSYQTDITKQVTESELDGSALGGYKEWFDKNTIRSYFDSAYPWTRLGYTYDWADDDIEYGLSEFIILPDSVVDVAWTVTTDEFIEMMKTGNISQQGEVI